MNKADSYYYNNIKEILQNGFRDENPRPKYKDGSLAYSRFITNVFEKYDLSKNEFPFTFARSTAIKTAIKEILWIYQKQSNSLEDARNLGINWWDNWDIGNNTIGNRYGYTVKKYNLIDNLLFSLKNEPFSRRHIINLLQETDLTTSKGLYPCAFETIWSVRKINNDLYLDCHLNQRSNDYIIAGYINKIQYVALQLMICSHLGYKPGTFSHLVNNLHIYERHIPSAEKLLDILTTNCLDTTEHCILELETGKNFYDISINDFKINKIVKTVSKLEDKLELAI